MEQPTGYQLVVLDGIVASSPPRRELDWELQQDREGDEGGVGFSFGKPSHDARGLSRADGGFPCRVEVGLVHGV